jgi:hypothetical protein
MVPLHWIIVAGIAFLVLVALWSLFKPRFGRMPFTKRPALLSPGELRFYRVLLVCLPPGVLEFVKVRLMDLVAVPDHLWRRYGAPANGMHVDFVVADAASTEVLLVIELDDRSHPLPSVATRDAFKEAVLSSAAVPILRIKAAGRYDTAESRVDSGLSTSLESADFGRSDAGCSVTRPANRFEPDRSACRRPVDPVAPNAA